jgi:hypothetical protein
MKAVIAILTALVVFSARPASAQSCEMLSSLKLTDATITMAQPVAAGAFTPPQGGGRGGGAQFADLPAFCRVAATLGRRRLRHQDQCGSPYRLERKFQPTGNGGGWRNIDTKALAAGIRRCDASTIPDIRAGRLDANRER